MFLEPPKGTGKNMNSKWVFFQGFANLTQITTQSEVFFRAVCQKRMKKVFFIAGSIALCLFFITVSNIIFYTGRNELPFQLICKQGSKQILIIIKIDLLILCLPKRVPESGNVRKSWELLFNKCVKVPRKCSPGCCLVLLTMQNFNSSIFPRKRVKERKCQENICVFYGY